MGDAKPKTILRSAYRPPDYRIDAVDHELSRDNGFTTTMSLKQPQGSGGSDAR